MGDSQGLKGANLKILGHGEVRWYFFLRYGLSKKGVTSSDERLWSSSKAGSSRPELFNC
jgi:hypothetical protein